MKNQITITCRDNGYILSVDGGSIECATETELMSRAGAEMGMPYMKANKEVFDQYAAVKKERDELTADRDKYKDWWYKLYRENSRLKEAICNAFVKEYAK